MMRFGSRHAKMMIEQSVPTGNVGLLAIIFLFYVTEQYIACLHTIAEYLKHEYCNFVLINSAAHGRVDRAAMSSVREGWLA